MQLKDLKSGYLVRTKYNSGKELGLVFGDFILFNDGYHKLNGSNYNSDLENKVAPYASIIEVFDARDTPEFLIRREYTEELDRISIWKSSDNLKLKKYEFYKFKDPLTECIVQFIGKTEESDVELKFFSYLNNTTFVLNSKKYLYPISKVELEDHLVSVAESKLYRFRVHKWKGTGERNPVKSYKINYNTKSLSCKESGSIIFDGIEWADLTDKYLLNEENMREFKKIINQY